MTNMVHFYEILRSQYVSMIQLLNYTTSQGSKTKRGSLFIQLILFSFKEECLEHIIFKIEICLVFLYQNNWIEHTDLSHKNNGGNSKSIKDTSKFFSI